MTTHEGLVQSTPSPCRAWRATAVVLALGMPVGCASKGVAGTGGPVSGPADMHCTGAAPEPTKQADCNVTEPDGGMVASSYGPTMYDQAGDDDGCKYHVAWTYTPIAQNEDVTFTVAASYLANGEPNPPACEGCPIAGLDSTNGYIEVGYSDPTHPPPNANPTVTATSTPGSYTFGPVRFDESGTWTVRFHFFALCDEVAKDSPHGHAAFYVHVP